MKTLTKDKKSSKSQHASTRKLYPDGKIVNLIKEEKKVVIDENENFHVDGTSNGKNVPIFLYDLLQPTEKINHPEYFKILEALNIK